MELFSFIVICEGRVWTVKFILYHQLECLLQGADRCIHWCGPHGLSITFPPEISRKFYFRVWTFLKLLTDLPRFLSTSLCLYESVTMILPNVSGIRYLIWMFWKKAENFLMHSGKFSFFSCFTSTFMLGWHQRSPDKPIGGERLISLVALLYQGLCDQLTCAPVYRNSLVTTNAHNHKVSMNVHNVVGLKTAGYKMFTAHSAYFHEIWVNDLRYWCQLGWFRHY